MTLLKIFSLISNCLQDTGQILWSCEVKFLLLSPASLSSLILLYEQLINLSNYFQFQEWAMSTFMTLHMLFLLTWIFCLSSSQSFLGFQFGCCFFWKASPETLNSENTLSCCPNTCHIVQSLSVYPPVSLTNTPHRQGFWLACSVLHSQYSAQCLTQKTLKSLLNRGMNKWHLCLFSWESRLIQLKEIGRSQSPVFEFHFPLLDYGCHKACLGNAIIPVSGYFKSCF